MPSTSNPNLFLNKSDFVAIFAELTYSGGSSDVFRGERSHIGRVAMKRLYIQPWVYSAPESFEC